MSAASNQLDEIYQQLKDSFGAHPLISVRPVKGNPPDQYEITYSLKGMAKDRGQIEQATHHIIDLAIPFGFPHFPPSCKPKSAVFHPDFDPAAICLGDFWGQDRTLAELIIHIGRMINGESYSTDNAFNEEAAEWYQQNSDQFPLTLVDWQASQPPSDPAPRSDSRQIDTIDDTDLTSDLNFLSLEKHDEEEEISLGSTFPEVDRLGTLDLQILKRLEEQRRYHALLKEAEAHKQQSGEVAELCQNARDAIRKAEKLHHEAKKIENRGEARAALRQYEQVAEMVADFPNLDADLHRARQTMELLEDIGPAGETASSDDDDLDEPVSFEDEPEEQAPRVAAKAGRKAKPKKFEDKTGPTPAKVARKSGLPLYLAAALAVALVGYLGYGWRTADQHLLTAKAAYETCLTAQENNQFDQAKLACEQALQAVDTVGFFKANGAGRLKEDIEAVLNSERFIQGLAGNILVDGTYIPKAQAQAILASQQRATEADSLYQQEKWPEALKAYQALLAQNGIKNHLPPETFEQLQLKRLITEFRMHYDPARGYIRNSQWEKAIEQLLRAQKILVLLPEALRGQYSQPLQQALQQCQFANLKAQGDLSFTESDWLSAIQAYNLALASSHEKALPPESIEAIRNNIKRAELYTAINRGNKAFAAGAWDEAITAYTDAGALLSNSGNMATDQEADINTRKLARIILQASLIRDRQAVLGMLDRGELAKAKKSYQTILANIAASPLKEEEEFTKASAETQAAIKQLDEKIFLNQKEQYLKENFQKIFAANYPAVVPEHLSNPVISHSKSTDSKLVFRLQCTESDGVRAMNLVMFYAFDKNTGKWGMFSDH